MSSNPDEFIVFALERMRVQEADLRKWAAQSDNPVLRMLARDVLQAAGEGKEKLGKKR